MIKNIRKIKIFKYVITWISIYWLNIGITFLLRDILGFSSEFSYFITMLLIIIYSFFMSLNIIFKVNFSFLLLFKYLLALISFSIINYFLVIYIKNMFWENYLYYIIISINTILAILKYYIYNNFIFNNTKKW